MTSGNAGPLLWAENATTAPNANPGSSPTIRATTAIARNAAEIRPKTG
jgi:hypothetical protein